MCCIQILQYTVIFNEMSKISGGVSSVYGGDFEPESADGKQLVANESASWDKPKLNKRFFASVCKM